jgi:phosphatidylinositol-3-phosphatase
VLARSPTPGWQRAWSGHVVRARRIVTLVAPSVMGCVLATSCVPLTGVLPTGSPANLIPNPTFNANLTGWIGTRSTLARVALSNVPSGKYVARVSLTHGASFSINTSRPVVSKTTASTEYQGYAYVKAASASAVGKKISMVVEEVSSTGQVVDLQSSSEEPLSHKFQELSVPYATRQSGGRIYVHVVEYGATRANAFYVDDVRLYAVSAAVSPYPHVLVIMEENQGYAATLGSCGSASPDPYWCSLASSYTSLTSWFAITHPSLPNYLAVTSGSNQGCGSDSCMAGLSANNLGNQLTQAAIPWTAYMESMPSPCFTGSASGEYAMKHNPFEYFSDDRSPCHDLPYPGASGIVSTLDGSSAPDFVWITPNLVDDMHDGSVQQGDAWLKSNLPSILKSSWFTNYDATVVITMDENEAQSGGRCCGDAAGGQVPTVVISNNAKGHGDVSVEGSHFGTLRTIEEAFKLPLLGGAADPANGDLTPYFG